MRNFIFKIHNQNIIILLYIIKLNVKYKREIVVYKSKF